MRERETAAPSTADHTVDSNLDLTSLFHYSLLGCQSSFFFLLLFVVIMSLVYADYVWAQEVLDGCEWNNSALFSVVMQIGVLRLYRKCSNCRLINVATFISLVFFQLLYHDNILVHLKKKKKMKMKSTWSAECQKKDCVLSNETERSKTILSKYILMTLSFFFSVFSS